MQVLNPAGLIYLENIMDVEQIKEAITKLFGDTSVPREETMDILQDIYQHTEQYIEAISADMDDASPNDDD
jgi:hypothetical protein